MLSKCKAVLTDTFSFCKFPSKKKQIPFLKIDPSTKMQSDTAVEVLKSIKGENKCNRCGCKISECQIPVDQPCLCWKPLSDPKTAKIIQEGCHIVFVYHGHCGEIELWLYPKCGGDPFIFKRHWLVPLSIIKLFGNNSLIVLRRLYPLNAHHKSRFMRFLSAFCYYDVYPFGLVDKSGYDGRIPGWIGLAKLVGTKYMEDDIWFDANSFNVDDKSLGRDVAGREYFEKTESSFKLQLRYDIEWLQKYEPDQVGAKFFMCSAIQAYDNYTNDF